MINADNTIKGGTACLVNPAIIMDANGEADAEITPTSIDYAINGLLYSVNSGDGDIKLDDNTVTAGYTVLFTVCVAAGGTITVVKGTEVANADIDAGNKVLKWPAPTADTCPIGGLKVKNATSAVFTGGTTHLDATDITTTAYNFFFMPSGNLTS